MTGSPTQRGGRIPELDGLRGVAILMVLLSHYIVSQAYGAAAGWFHFISPALNLTWSGVDLFFVLSGFLIGGILLDHRGSPRYFRTFYLRRFWRIVPVYALVCGSFWGLGFFLDRLKVERPYWLFHAALPWPAYATMTQNIWLALIGGYFGANWLGVTWSLAVEEQFYLCAPMVIRWIRPSHLPGFLCYMIIVGWVLRQLCQSLFLFVFPSGPLSAYVLMPCHLDGLAAGMLAAWAVREPRATAWLKLNRRLLFWAVMTSFAGLVLFALEGWHMFSRPMSLVGYSLLAFFYSSALLHAVLFKDSVLSATLRFQALQKLGMISYCVYLIHQPIAGLCHWLLLNEEPFYETGRQAAVTLLALAITLALAGISWRFLERPLIERGHKHVY